MAKKMFSGISAKDIAGLAVGAAAASKVATMGCSFAKCDDSKSSSFLTFNSRYLFNEEKRYYWKYWYGYGISRNY